MILFLIAIFLVLFFYFLLKIRNNDSELNSGNDSGLRFNSNDVSQSREVNLLDDEISEVTIYTDPTGNEYTLEKRVREIPRRTYVKGVLRGKYHGVWDETTSLQYEQENFYNIEIYEATLFDAVYSKNPFRGADLIGKKEELIFPITKIPNPLPICLLENGAQYEICLREPVFSDLIVNRKLHQEHDDLVFGTIEVKVSGYVLDYIYEEYLEKIYIEKESIPVFQSESNLPVLEKTNIPTGEFQVRGNYKSTEYFFSDMRNKYWGDWEFTASPKRSLRDGCSSQVFGIIAIIIAIIFILLVLPRLAILLPFLAIYFIISLIPLTFFSKVFQFLRMLFLVGFLASLLYFIFKPAGSSSSIPKHVDKPEEIVLQGDSILDTTRGITSKSAIIRHLRIWQDYDGNEYKGTIWTKVSDFKESQNFKNSLNFTGSSSDNYDQMVSQISEFDSENLIGVYSVFDSIQSKIHLSNIKFAELIVSFVQDIPYSVVLPDDCDASLYNDSFIKEYLSSPGALCDGNQKFGINSPLEFMTTLSGDCDTRTLLLYTMLNHYNFDVALLSSDYYSHSILGVNIPVRGTSYKSENSRYVLWETTSPNLKPGVLPSEIANLNYWRISIKSK